MAQASVWAVMRPPNGCAAAGSRQVYRWANAPERVDYVDEWDETARRRPPVVEFKDVSGTRGLELIAAAAAPQGPRTIGTKP